MPAEEPPGRYSALVLGVRAGISVLVACLMAMALPGGALATGSSLYRGPAPRPGPDILYRAPAQAPQLSNAPGWSAKPILISGASAYRAGEFLYQDYLYDDHGAKAPSRDPGDPRTSGDSFSRRNGTYTYPTAPVYANNAADLVELRVEPGPESTAFRITFNTMKQPALVGTTIAIGGSAQPRDFPHGANASAPASLFLTVHGSKADLIDAATRRPILPAPQVSVDKVRRQIQVIVSHRAWNPGQATVRLAAGVGLWDTSAGRYLVPRARRRRGPPRRRRRPGEPDRLFQRRLPLR